MTRVVGLSLVQRRLSKGILEATYSNPPPRLYAPYGVEIIFSQPSLKYP